MAEAKTTPRILELATKATTKEVAVPLDQFKLRPELYCHRMLDELTKVALQPLMDSLALEGMQAPVEAFKAKDGKYVPTKGYRRLTCARLLAEDNHPGFKPDMAIRTILVQGATEQDLLLRSVLDNENRKNLSQLERIQVVKKFQDAGVPIQRAASALGVNEVTYRRDLLLADHPWMYDLIVKNSIVPTTASALLNVAVKEGRVAELEANLKDWIAGTERQIAEKVRQREQKGGKELRPAERTVKTYMTKPLVAHWVTQLHKKEQFDQAISYEAKAGIDPDSNELSVEGMRVNLAKAPIGQLAKIAGRLSQVARGVAAFAKTRQALEAVTGPQAQVRDMEDQPFDLEFLRNAGLGEFADDLEHGPLEEGEGTPESVEEDADEDADGN